MKCKICGSIKNEIFLQKDKWVLYKCKKCFNIFLYPQLSKKDLQDYYGDSYYSYNELNSILTHSASIFTQIKFFLLKVLIASYQSKFYMVFRMILSPVKNRFGGIPKDAKNKKILDVGCGDGLFIYSLLQFGADVYGIDINKRAINIGKVNRLKVSVASDIGKAEFRDNYFDIVRMWHVVEHTYDPKRILKQAYVILKDKGILIIGVPNIRSLAFKLLKSNWSALDLPIHFYHFSPNVIKALLQEVGFKKIMIQYRSVGTIQASLQMPYFLHVVSLPFFLLMDYCLDIWGRGDVLEITASK